jgi:hypothetical protein
METPEFIKKIDWTDLRTQKTLLLETINNDAVDPEHKEGLEGILALIDAVQDYAVDEMGVSEMHVYDFELEEERDGMVVSDKTKTVFLCSNCASDNVEMKAWVNPNTDDIGDTISTEDEDCYCNDCKGHYKLLSYELKVSTKVVGFQVVGEDGTENDGDIHPTMDASFCLYNLTQARDMMKNSNNWRLLTIWTGDIEEPTFMFEGDPRNEDLGTTDGHIDPTNR